MASAGTIEKFAEDGDRTVLQHRMGHAVAQSGPALKKSSNLPPRLYGQALAIRTGGSGTTIQTPPRRSAGRRM